LYLRTIEKLVIKAAKAIWSFAKTMWNAMMNFDSEWYLNLDLSGGIVQLIGEQVVGLKIDFSLFGFQADWNIQFCLPINVPCLNIILQYAWHYVKCVTQKK
jgi:hypothetical protein